ncbi:hypothetical protein BD780_002294 [Clostridium tetanomorphum]|uniref:Uncharacterized protein n=1 Tax=Clostridium tetanomorphum TaxID=1553 RepID=A0A923E585_CLOTT|nr:hypothetical protein [Clostridium tetanomorphum]KAJ53353.1 hypothetical protein CTM_02644 [Clostridium tetanomorphum DSM 665]MBC2396660.1 hypothetical protein [Clostridium tetanomorphum]MBP1863991.1 hypothetical protein [Clostridium tetanomorphum]NRS85069.1 hypothetical protein [Clostridium tetanomorphum]NRZ98286.1 hypothetical protein [Clostridium tetanomorphum]
MFNMNNNYCNPFFTRDMNPCMFNGFFCPMMRMHYSDDYNYTSPLIPSEDLTNFNDIRDSDNIEDDYYEFSGIKMRKVNVSEIED